MIEIIESRDMTEKEKKEYLLHNEEVRKLNTDKNYISKHFRVHCKIFFTKKMFVLLLNL